VVTWEDSPLVKAVRSGHVLVVDEVDKAPVEVVGGGVRPVTPHLLLFNTGRFRKPIPVFWQWPSASFCFSCHTRAVMMNRA